MTDFLLLAFIFLVADVYQVGVPAHENEAYVAKLLEILEEWEPEVQATMTSIRTTQDK